MKRFFLLLVTLLSFPLMAQTTLADRPVAVVKLHRTEVIPQSKFEQYINVLQSQNQTELTLEQKKDVLDVMVNQMLVKQDADSLGIQVADEMVLQTGMQQLSFELQQVGAIPQGAFLNDVAQFEQVLSQQGMNPTLYLENIKNSLIIRDYILQSRQSEFMAIEKPSDQEIRTFYNGNISLFAIPEYVQVRQIFFNFNEGDPTVKRINAQDLFAKIESGQAAFDTSLAIEGDLFPMNQDRLQPLFIAAGDQESLRVFGTDFNNALFSGKSLGVPYLIESTLGMHIIVIDEWSEPDVRTLSDTVSPVESQTVKDFIAAMIYEEKQSRLYQQLQQQVVLDLRESATEEGVKIFEDAIR